MPCKRPAGQPGFATCSCHAGRCPMHGGSRGPGCWRTPKESVPSQREPDTWHNAGGRLTTNACIVWGTVAASFLFFFGNKNNRQCSGYHLCRKGPCPHRIAEQERSYPQNVRTGPVPVLEASV